MDHPLIPPIGSVSQAFRAFRVAWVSALGRSADGEPVVPTSFAAQHARVLHFIDVRDRDELVGPMGRIPGSFSVPGREFERISDTLMDADPIVVVDAYEERAPAAAALLEARGHRLVAFLRGGLDAWRAHGLGVTRDELGADDELRRVVPSFDAQRRVLSAEDVREHVGDPRALQRQKLAALLTHGRLSCVDGRDHGALLGTPGGDGGELLLVLSALERVTGRRLGDDDVARILLRRLDAFGHCAVHTDIAAANRIIATLRAAPNLARHVEGIQDTLEWRRFWMRPPRELHDELLEIAIQPEHLGCGHIKLSLTQAERYGTRPEFVRAFLRAFFRLRWQGSTETEYAPLPGGHAEGAVLRVRVEGGVGPFSFVPLLSPLCAGTQTFVAHPEVSTAMRRLTTRLLSETGEIPSAEVARLDREIDALAEVQLANTLQALAAGLPVFDLWFSPHGPPRVEAAGNVPD
jgi:rhodanese-related sulfurtransferase